MSNEIALMQNLRVEASRLGARLFRQQVGSGWIGKAEEAKIKKTVQVGPGDVVIRKARRFQSGFEGWSDLGGWAPVTITPEMVGQTVAVYLQAEVKDGARVTDEQKRWIEIVNRAGGIAGVVRSVDDLAALISRK